MPELPEVEVSRKYIESIALDKTIKDIQVKNPKILDQISAVDLVLQLRGNHFRSTYRHGKYILIRTDKQWLTVHYGMGGSLEYFDQRELDPPHDRLLLTFENGFYLAYDCQRMFGRVGLAASVEEFIHRKKLGPDALAVDSETFIKQLQTRRGIIKSILMDQHVIAGLGNLYVDELLFQTGIHPNTRISKLEEFHIKELFENMQRILQKAIELEANYIKYPESYLIQQRYKGGLCPLDKTEVESLKIGGRTTFFCPNHQKLIN